MTTTQALDDLEAVRTVAQALEGFTATDQERIIRWAREKLGLPLGTTSDAHGGAAGASSPVQPAAQAKDIKSFVQSKNPQSDNQFAATVAYYYRFEAPEGERKESITATDLTDATRMVGRDRVARPAQTLINAHQQGLLDKAGERGSYAVNTVGENLVAMALPGTDGSAKSVNRRQQRQSRKKKNTSRRKKRPARK
jgi:hypothetical protein